jgi:hypothetical protein
MKPESLRQWHSKKDAISDSIFEDQGLFGEPDAQILLCCSISALPPKDCCTIIQK